MAEREMIPVEIKCRDFGERPGCLGTPDPRFTMDFSDIGEDPIYWCSFCGAEAQALDAALVSALHDGRVSPDQLKSLLEEAEAKEKEKKN